MKREKNAVRDQLSMRVMDENGMEQKGLDNGAQRRRVKKL